MTGQRPGFVLHIGPHKTGTTALQAALTRNRDLLGGRGFHYPAIGTSFWGHHPIATAVGEPSGQHNLERFISELLKIDGTVILSSENFSRQQEDHVARLARRLEPWNVRVVFYLRSFLEMLYGTWQQRLIHKRTDEFPEFLAECMARPNATRPLNADAVLGIYMKAFGRDRIEIYDYRQCLQQYGDIGQHFVTEVLGISDLQIPRKKMNTTYPYTAVELMRVLNLLGRSGVRLLRDRRATELLLRMEELSDRYVKRISLSYDDPIFGRLEAELRDNWHDRIVGLEDRERFLFKSRTASIEYLSPSIWIAEQDLADEVHSLSRISVRDERASEAATDEVATQYDPGLASG